MTTTKLNDHANLPDDPADCCRAICHALLPLTDFGRKEMPGQFAELVAVLSDQEQHEAEAWERTRYALGIFAHLAHDEAEAQIAAVDRALSLARHGTGDHREADRRIAEGKSAFPPGPTVAEVAAARKVLAAYGDDDSEEAALRVLGSMEGDDVVAAS